MAALALRAGQVVSFEALADAVWGDDAARAARVTVRNYMLRLRRALGDDGARIVTRDPGYLLDVADGDVDALAFDCQCEAGAALARSEQWEEAATTLREALRMWRGTPLADVPSGPLRDHWGRYLEQARMRALRERIRADLQVGRHEAVAGELRALTAAYPLDEGLWRLLLLALYRSGQQGGALAAYRQARATLVAELGVEPGPDLRLLHEQILSHDPSLDIPTASALPGRKTPPVPWQLVPWQLPTHAAEPKEPVDRGQAMTWLAPGRYAVQGESSRPMLSLADCLDLYEQLGVQGSVARVHLSLARLAERQGDYPESLGHARQALQLFQAIGHQAGQASALQGIGWCHAQLGHVEYKLGNYAAAIDCHLSAVRICREAGDRYAEGEILTNLGDVYQAAGDTPAAKNAWEQALDILTGLDHPDAGRARLRPRLGDATDRAGGAAIRPA